MAAHNFQGKVSSDPKKRYCVKKDYRQGGRRDVCHLWIYSPKMNGARERLKTFSLLRSCIQGIKYSNKENSPIWWLTLSVIQRLMGEDTTAIIVSVLSIKTRMRSNISMRKMFQ